MASALCEKLKDSFVRQDFYPVLRAFVRHPCDRTSDGVIDFLVRERAKEIAFACPQVLLSAIEAGFQRPLSEAECGLLMDARVDPDQMVVVWPWRGPLLEVVDREQFQEACTSALGQNLLTLRSGTQWPLPDIFEAEAIRRGISMAVKTCLKAGNTKQGYPYLYLVASTALLRVIKGLYESKGKPGAFSELVNDILSRQQRSDS